jgi:protoporphyrinogen IX oxidase
MFILFKSLHLVAVGIWFAGLFLLPNLMAMRARTDPDCEDDYFVPLARRLYFHVMTPAGVVAVVVGGGLIAATQYGAWLPAKLVLVAMALGLHVYLGLALFDLSNGRNRHSAGLFSTLGWIPLLLMLGIVGLSTVKPLTLAPLDRETVIPAQIVPLDPGAPEVEGAEQPPIEPQEVD